MLAGMNPIREPGDGPMSLFETASLTDALLGRDLPADAETELRLAGLAYQSDEEAERHLFRARALAPDHPAVLIGFYQFYFYKSRLEDALMVARLCLLKAARDNALSSRLAAGRARGCGLRQLRRGAAKVLPLYPQGLCLSPITAWAPGGRTRCGPEDRGA